MGVKCLILDTQLKPLRLWILFFFFGWRGVAHLPTFADVRTSRGGNCYHLLLLYQQKNPNELAHFFDRVGRLQGTHRYSEELPKTDVLIACVNGAFHTWFFTNYHSLNTLCTLACHVDVTWGLVPNLAPTTAPPSAEVLTYFFLL